MRFFIKEWPNKSATLMAENGTVLWTFANAEAAEKVCKNWSQVQKDNPGYQLYNLGPHDSRSAVA